MGGQRAAARGRAQPLPPLSAGVAVRFAITRGPPSPGRVRDACAKGRRLTPSRASLRRRIASAREQSREPRQRSRREGAQPPDLDGSRAGATIMARKVGGRYR